jgi:hypothetical protein
MAAFAYTTALPSIQGLVDHPRYGEVIRQLYVANYNGGGNPVDVFQQTGLTDRDLRLSNHDHHRAIVMELMDMNVVHMAGIQSRYEFLSPVSSPDLSGNSICQMFPIWSHWRWRLR